MNKLVFFAFVVTVITAVVAENEDKYTTKFDDVDIHDILKNKRLLKGYVKCLMDEGPCSADGNLLKKVLPDAIETNCEKCSEKQQTGSRTVLRHLIDHEPQFWSQLEKKYDPSGEYKNKYREQAKKDGIHF